MWQIFSKDKKVELFRTEDEIVQRSMIIFDHSLGVLDPSIEDEILLYHLISCMYIIYKVEARFSLLTFEEFLYQNVSKKSYDALQSHLSPHL